MYKKRLAKHKQKKIYALRVNKRVSKRTINAIENNESWIVYYKEILRLRNLNVNKSKV